MAHPPPEPANLLPSLQRTLEALSHSPYPRVPNPPACKKRASVALIIRIRPHFDHPPPAPAPAPDAPQPPSLATFFAQPWVQAGDAEVLFIKRAARPGDRWTSHVALPGGKRDPDDASDHAAAVREALEEVGLDLGDERVVSIGNLPERVVQTSWSKIPIMVLCPFVFLYVSAEVPNVRLQPGEVASTHWVPLRVLLSPAVRTWEYVDVSDRFARQGSAAVKTLIRSVLGTMRFSAVRLVPAESVFCTSTAEFFPPPADDAGTPRPLLLWGLTLGVLADFLDELPPRNAVALWRYPTFTQWDARFWVWVLTRGVRGRNGERARVGNQTAVDGETEAVAVRGEGYAVGILLEGYYERARVGVWLAMLGRVAVGVGGVGWVLRRWVRGRV